MPKRLRLPLGAAIVFFGLALGVQRGVLVSLDGNVYWKVSQSIVHRRSLMPVLPAGWDQLKIHTPYSSFGIGMSLWLIPFVWLQDRIDPNGQGIVTVANPLMLAACVALLVTIVQRLKVRNWIAAAAALSFGVLTTALFHSTEGFAEPGVTFCLLLTVLGLLIWRDGTPRAAWLVGIGLAGSVLFRTDSVVTILPLLAIVPFVISKKTLTSTMRAWVPALLVPVFIVGAWTGWYNNLRYGSPLTAGYPGQGFTNKLIYGLDELVVSPGKGLFWYAPIVILGAVGLKASWTRERFLTLFIAALFVGRIIFYARWNSPEGGVGWGPRFMLPICALALIPAAIWIEAKLDRPSFRRNLALAFAGLLVALGLVVNLVSVWVPYEQYVNDIRFAKPGETQAQVDVRLNQYVHDIPASHIVANWRRLDHARPFPLKHFDGGPSPIAVLAIGIMLGGGWLLGASRTRNPRRT